MLFKIEFVHYAIRFSSALFDQLINKEKIEILKGNYVTVSNIKETVSFREDIHANITLHRQEELFSNFSMFSFSY